MGLLDDAIREHLDLKRRRGADPAEVERAEREALGPVRRNREPADADQLQPEPGSADDLAHDNPEPLGDADAFAYDYEDDEAGWERHQAGAGPPADTLPVDDSGGEEVGSDEWARSSSESVPSAHRPHDEMGGNETAEYDVEGALAAGDEGDDDVLEETPEFLQDTPDHDRLWFEQRPPRDFDFDG